ncbi:hypothetical protein TRIUR3_30041 [Triticum urartu]|uniref:Uncharacterized protein n=1 Tax=Triticum urartu TaxID=4572 RepID=M8AAS7_TRIUA|nr:hypothetical protein TRIUR3_30041 [Triticum urartu]
MAPEEQRKRREERTRGAWGAGGGLGKEEGLGAAEEEAGRRIREACVMREETARPQRPVGMVLQQQEVNGGAAARRRARRPGLTGRSDDGVIGWRGDEVVGETEQRNEVTGGGSNREQAPVAGISWAATTRSLAGQGDDSWSQQGSDAMEVRARLREEDEGTKRDSSWHDKFFVTEDHLIFGERLKNY